MSSPSVSVIITTFNRSAMLRRSLRSALSQTYSDFEVIILDNNSSDDTEAVVKSFEDLRIRYIKHPPLFIAEARNLGVKEAYGQYLGFLDDDDEWLPEKLKKQVEIFQKGPRELGLVYSGFTIVDDLGRTLRTELPHYRGQLFERIIATRNALTGSASVPLIRRACYDKVGLYEPSLKTYEDDELYIRIAKEFTWDFVPEVLVKIHLHRGYKLGGRIHDQVYSVEYLYNLYKQELQRYPLTESSYLQTIGGLLCRLGRLKEGRDWIKKALQKNPKNWQARFQLLLSFFGVTIYRQAHRFYKSVLKKGYAIPEYES